MPQDSTANVQLVLDGALTMRTIEAIRATFRAAIEPPAGIAPAQISPSGIAPSGTAPCGTAPSGIAPSGIAIDCSAATEIDLTFIQLLVAARISARIAGLSINFVPCPDGVLLDTLTRGGFRVVPENGAGFWFTGEAQ
jgi:hypothetical protein